MGIFIPQNFEEYYASLEENRQAYREGRATLGECICQGFFLDAWFVQNHGPELEHDWFVSQIEKGMKSEEIVSYITDVQELGDGGVL